MSKITPHLCYLCTSLAPQAVRLRASKCKGARGRASGSRGPVTARGVAGSGAALGPCAAQHRGEHRAREAKRLCCASFSARGPCPQRGAGSIPERARVINVLVTENGFLNYLFYFFKKVGGLHIGLSTCGLHSSLQRQTLTAVFPPSNPLFSRQRAIPLSCHPSLQPRDCVQNKSKLQPPN